MKLNITKVSKSPFSMKRLALLLSSCAIVASPLAVPTATAEKPPSWAIEAGAFTLDIDTVLNCANTEPIELTGTAYYHFAFIFDGGGVHLQYGAHEVTIGIGLVSGDFYRGSGTFKDSIQNVRSGTQVVNLVTNARLVGRNGQITNVSRDVQVTVDGTMVRDFSVQFSCFE
jgi:hypothetical protein